MPRSHYLQTLPALFANNTVDILANYDQVTASLLARTNSISDIKDFIREFETLWKC